MVKVLYYYGPFANRNGSYEDIELNLYFKVYGFIPLSCVFSYITFGLDSNANRFAVIKS